jgi:hypothetical protein
MQPSSYGVDSSKGAANISNPYDFKNVQVRNLYIISMLKIYSQLRFIIKY